MSDGLWGNLRRYGALAGLLVLLAVVLLWPIVLTVRGGFVDRDGRLTLRYVAEVFRNPVLVEGLSNSVRIAAYTTLAALAMALPLAVLAVRHRFRGRGLLSALILVPLILPPFVGAIGLRAILGRFGAVNALLVRVGLWGAGEPGVDFLGAGMAGVVAMEALHLFPIMYLNLAAALANVDPAMEEAAQTLGAGPVRRFLRITLPLMLPGVFGGATLTFIWSFTELGTPLMFSFRRVTAVQVFEGLQELHVNPRPYALVVIMLAAAVVAYLVGRVALGRRGYAMTGKAGTAADERRLSTPGTLVAWAIFGVVIGLAVLPHVGVVLNSLAVQGTWYRTILPGQWTLEHYRGALAHPLAVGAIRNSLTYSLLATAVCVAVGTASSLVVVRGRPMGGWLLDAMVMLPLAVPGLVMAFGYAAMTLRWPFGREGPLSGWASVFGVAPNPLLLLVVAYAVRRLPYVARSVSAGLEQTSVSLEEAAMNLGASRWRTLRKVTLPLIAANVGAGALLAFSFAMLEVSDSLVLAQKEAHYPVTKAIYDLYGRLGDGPYIASAMGVWAMGLLTLTLVGASLLIGRRMGALFRV